MTSRPNRPSRTPPVVVALGAVRYRRTPERIADDIDAGFADIAPLARFVLANLDIGHTDALEIADGRRPGGNNTFGRLIRAGS
ncbi:hypothetical protein AB0H00_27740 [Nocardia sp. NPDC023852]|uniref:hypothetical protein n=1 Tax=Nocardia sp. NPDC023852 TaxID=3154697 RepID=UPI0033FB2D71